MTHLQLSCPGTNDSELCKDGPCDDFNLDDVDLTFQNYEELFGLSHNQTGHFFDDHGIDVIFDPWDTYAANSNCQDEFVGEVHIVAFALSVFLRANTIILLSFN